MGVINTHGDTAMASNRLRLAANRLKTLTGEASARNEWLVSNRCRKCHGSGYLFCPRCGGAGHRGEPQ